MKIQKGDTILVAKGKDRLKKAKVLATNPKKGTILAENVNLRTKHQKARKQGEKGQKVQVPNYLSAANVMLVCPKCNAATRVGYKFSGDKKVRVCKKCKAEIK